MIYLDYAANTPVDDEVLNAYVEATKKYTANPNSSHYLGKMAKEKIDEVSGNISKYFKCSSKNIIYTSGSSESNNLVIKGICEQKKNIGRHIIISEVEHSSVVAPCNYLASKGYDVSVIPLTKEGKINLDILKEELRDDTILVSIAAVDSELGTVEQVEEIGEIVKKYPNCTFHTDATQAVGKIELDYTNVDFITFAPHKFFGLNGFGVLVNMHNEKLTPLIHGGKSTTIFRSGTPQPANVIALGKAFEIATTKLQERFSYTSNLNKKLRDSLSKLDAVHINSPKDAIPTTLNISLINKDTKKILKSLEEKDIYLSTTSACSMEDAPSKSVYAITHDDALSRNSIRISISHLTTEEDIETFLREFINILKNN